jgi:hypothetical protein
VLTTPYPVPRKVWRKKKAYGSTNIAGLTLAEIVRRGLLAKKGLKGPRIKQRFTHLSLLIRKILAYYRPLQYLQGWRNLPAQRGVGKDPGLYGATHKHCMQHVAAQEWPSISLHGRTDSHLVLARLSRPKKAAKTCN